MPEEPDPPPKKLTFKAAEFESVNAPEGAEPPANSDPLEILQANREHEKAAKTVFDQSPAPVPRITPRIWNYLLIMAVVNTVFGFLLHFNQDTVINVFLVAGMLLFNGGFSWTMLVVQDD